MGAGGNREIARNGIIIVSGGWFEFDSTPCFELDLFEDIGARFR